MLYCYLISPFSRLIVYSVRFAIKPKGIRGKGLIFSSVTFRKTFRWHFSKSISSENQATSFSRAPITFRGRHPSIFHAERNTTTPISH